jgi:metallo-beta-lactamase class B
MPPTILTRRNAIFLCTAALAQATLPKLARADIDPDWTTPLPPFQIAQNLYYVGSRDLASFLITTPQGNILLNSNLVTSPPQIRAAIEKLGFHYRDTKILLVSHAHYDHCAGSAQIKRETGAKYMVMDADVPETEAGGHGNFRYADQKDMLYLPAKVDRILHEGDKVELGGITLTAHKTAGHTKGCTTYTMKTRGLGPGANKELSVVFVGSPNVNPGYNLINDPKYPHMAQDFTNTFITLKSLPCDIFLGAHGGYFDMLNKLAKQKSGAQNVFIDPAGYKAYIADRQQAFESELARQRSIPKTNPTAVKKS